MVRHGIVCLLLFSLANSMIGCASRTWISSDAAVREQSERQRSAEITAVQLGKETIKFAAPGGSYDSRDASITGRTADGRIERFSIDSLQKCLVHLPGNDTSAALHDYSRSMIMSRLKRTSVEPIFALRLNSDTTSTVKLQMPYGRFWLFDSTLAGISTTGENYRTNMQDVHSVQVMRFSQGKTLLVLGGLAALAAGIIVILWNSSGPMLKDLPPINPA